MPAKKRESLLEAEHSPGQVKFATGVTESQLHHWFSRNLMELTYRGHGHGRQRKFTALEAIRLAIMASLDNQGVTIKKARDIALAITAPLELGKRIPENAIECIFHGPPPALKGIKPVTDWNDDLYHVRVSDPLIVLNDPDEWIVSMTVIPLGRTIGEVLHRLKQDVLIDKE